MIPQHKLIFSLISDGSIFACGGYLGIEERIALFLFDSTHIINLSFSKIKNTKCRIFYTKHFFGKAVSWFHFWRCMVSVNIIDFCRNSRLQNSVMEKFVWFCVWKSAFRKHAFGISCICSESRLLEKHFRIAFCKSCLGSAVFSLCHVCLIITKAHFQQVTLVH